MSWFDWFYESVQIFGRFFSADYIQWIYGCTSFVVFTTRRTAVWEIRPHTGSQRSSNEASFCLINFRLIWTCQNVKIFARFIGRLFSMNLWLYQLSRFYTWRIALLATRPHTVRGQLSNKFRLIGSILEKHQNIWTLLFGRLYSMNLWFYQLCSFYN